ncbi:glycosyltransferase family 39 protein [Winogradskyella immobilis]|uniref:Glycosyltransferase RgtA/B/C/D-like domain-containing protein n=1 Tax=Winogradskyella immobilis TaxID=2816852 RepID=A0ABS8ELJ7_9FLAO|nr:glycosyltransferase family 39 protein [Winogradskyella immobilis]MCC1484090.1 hypothetical protein [Winogradskyella immobilis]MCG0016182.1 glycosyltransferase family 39 protein [Winogradskyella immobilis]
MINHYKSNQKDFYLAVVIVVFIQLILGFQGFDVCDDGFALTFYQQIFSNPISVEYNFVYWLSGIVGGLWYQLYPGGGVFWFKILALVFNTGTFIVSFNILKPYIKSSYVLVVALAIALFINDFGFLVFYNNHITAFLSVLSIYFLQRGLIKSNSKFLLFSGFFIGLNVFSRLPNISQFAFLMVIPIVFYFNKKSFRNSIQYMLSFCVGIISAFLSVYLLLVALGQLEIMKDAVVSLYDIGNTENSSHNVTDLLKVYYTNYIRIIKYGLAFCVLILGYFFTQKRIKQYQIIKWIAHIITFSIVILWLNKGGIYSLYALGYIGVFGVLIFEKKQIEIKSIALMALVLQFLLPFGSGGGIRSIGYMCLWLSIPLFFYFISRFNTIILKPLLRFKLSAINNSSINKRNAKYFAFIFSLAFIALKFYNTSQQSYFDYGSRLDKTYAINSEFTKGIYTTQRRADIINELLVNLKDYVDPDDYLFAYDKIPMIHFLTETKPYMYNSWPWIYDINTFDKKLYKAEKEIKTLPVVVVQKFETIVEFSEPKIDYMSSTTEDNYLHNNQITGAMNDFLLRNNYQIVWSNPYFNIYETHKKHK